MGWAGRVAASPLHSPSADSDTESYLKERGAEAPPLIDSGGRSTTSTDADAVPSVVKKGKPRVKPRSLLPV